MTRILTGGFSVKVRPPRMPCMKVSVPPPCLVLPLLREASVSAQSSAASLTDFCADDASRPASSRRRGELHLHVRAPAEFPSAGGRAVDVEPPLLRQFPQTTKMVPSARLRLSPLFLPSATSPWLACLGLAIRRWSKPGALKSGEPLEPPLMSCLAKLHMPFLARRQLRWRPCGGCVILFSRRILKGIRSRMPNENGRKHR